VRVAAPGKLLLSGAYVVLDGSPAIVMAIDRYAVADSLRRGSPSAEVAAAMPVKDAPHVDATELFSGDKKLGLGSSAAVVVAALGVVAAERGADLEDEGVRRDLFNAARAAHAEVQSGGSGVDIAASVYGGVLRYEIDGRSAVRVARAALPQGLHLETYWSGECVRTSDMRARVDALRSRDRATFDARMRDLSAAARDCSAAVAAGDATAFVQAASASECALAALGQDADAPIVPTYARELARAAKEEGAAFCPSGAGGGDIFVRFALAPASARFTAAARAARLDLLKLGLDVCGVKLADRIGSSHP
jgi:phosphomevalonate kinase